MRFSLIDRIVDLRRGESITALKNVSLAEEYLQDHFPGFPILPGVLMVEALVQAGAWLMRHTDDFRYSTALLKDAKAVRFNNFVKPGRTLSVTCEVVRQEGSVWTFKGSGIVDGLSAVNARITLEQFNLGDKHPDLKASDDLRIGVLREQFKLLWTPVAEGTSAPQIG